MTDLPADSDYLAHLPDVRLWDSVDAFIGSSSWQPGVHVVMLPSGAHVDLMLGGDLDAIPPGRGLPVVLSGAVTKRAGRPGPFFSGIGLGRSLDSAFVAISDPTLTVDRDLRLGWYAGRVGEDVQGRMVALLSDLQRRVGRELLLAGGSGAGFASMVLGSHLDVPASAMVWNPQTDLLAYEPRAVEEYLAVALGVDAEQVRAMSTDKRAAALVTGGVQHAVGRSTTASGLRRLLYLQNAGDHHVVGHLAPFLEADGYRHEGGGRWRNDRGHLALVSAFSENHDPPPRPAMVRGLELLLDPTADVDSVVDRLQEERLLPHTDLDLVPRDLRDEVDDVAARTGLRATVDVDGTLRAALVWDGRPNRYAGVSTAFDLIGQNGSNLGVHARRDNAVTLPGTGSEVTSVRARIRDGFLNEVLSLTAPVTRTPQRLRVLIVGSCVSRDTFEFLRPDHFGLEGYVARQSLISAFGGAGAPPFDLSVLPSAFQRRMLEGDAASSLVRTVDDLDVDLVVWDLVDERLGILDHEGGVVTTDSVELRHAVAEGQATATSSGDEFGSERHLERFTAALPAWSDLLDRRGLRSRTVLLAPPWAETTDAGESTPSSFGLEAARANAVSELYLSAVDDVLSVPVVGRGLSSVRGKEAHQWGAAPFHYDDDTYRALAEGIASFATSLSPWGWDGIRPLDLVRTPDPAERDPRRRGAAPRVVLAQTGPLEVSATVHAQHVTACSFALHHGAQRIDSTPYVRAFTHRFGVRTPGIYRCRVYLMTENGERVPVTSAPLRVS